MNLILMGLRASGKTTVGQLLAERLARPFVDLDVLTLRELACDSVSAAWEAHGQSAFRRAESRALAQSLAGPAQVIALGGGTPIAPGAEDLLQDAKAKGRAIVVYLRAEPALLRARMMAAEGADRPAILGGDPIAEVEAVLALREPVFRSLADHVVDAAQGPEELADRIAALVAGARSA